MVLLRSSRSSWTNNMFNICVYLRSSVDIFLISTFCALARKHISKPQYYSVDFYLSASASLRLDDFLYYE